MTDYTFWMVWCPNGHAPPHRHASKDDAVAEAIRLAGQHSYSSFYVLEALSMVQRDTPPVTVKHLYSRLVATAPPQPAPPPQPSPITEASPPDSDIPF